MVRRIIDFIPQFARYSCTLCWHCLQLASSINRITRELGCLNHEITFTESKMECIRCYCWLLTPAGIVVDPQAYHGNFLWRWSQWSPDIPLPAFFFGGGRVESLLTSNITGAPRGTLCLWLPQSTGCGASAYDHDPLTTPRFQCPRYKWAPRTTDQ